MGMCRHCGEKAGWFSDVHESCISAAKEGSDKIASLISSAVSSKLVPPSDRADDDVWSRELAEEVWSETKPQVDELAGRHQYPAMTDAVQCEMAGVPEPRTLQQQSQCTRTVFRS